MLGTIGIKDHLIKCVIGNLPKERKSSQKIYIDLQAGVDFSPTDALEDTVCYAHLAEICTQLATQRKYRLLETFALEAAKKLLEEPNVLWVVIRVKKPGAIPTAKYAYAELKLEKNQVQA